MKYFYKLVKVVYCENFQEIEIKCLEEGALKKIYIGNSIDHLLLW